MKRQIIVILLILIGELSLAQANYDDAKIKAQADFNDGNYVLHSLEFQPVESTYLFLLSQDYNIRWRFIDQDSLTYYSCYDSVLIQHLNKKFGNDFLKVASAKADSLEKTDNWKKDPEFPGGNSAMFKFINDRLRIGKGNLGTKLQSKVVICFTITKTGELENIKVAKGINKEIDNKIVQIFSEMPNWMPAYLYGKPIKQYCAYPISIEIK